MCSITLADKIDNLDEVCPIVPPPPAPVKKAPPAPPAVPLPPKAEAAKPAAAGTADAKVIAALTKNCGQCHTGARSKGKNVIFNDDGSLNPNLQKAEMAKAISEGKMPPKQRGPLSEEDRTVILSFLNGK
jgi:mono/diheme cytochrome c family protein